MVAIVPLVFGENDDVDDDDDGDYNENQEIDDGNGGDSDGDYGGVINSKDDGNENGYYAVVENN